MQARMAASMHAASVVAPRGRTCSAAERITTAGLAEVARGHSGSDPRRMSKENSTSIPQLDEHYPKLGSTVRDELRELEKRWGGRGRRSPALDPSRSLPRHRRASLSSATVRRSRSRRNSGAKSAPSGETRVSSTVNRATYFENVKDRHRVAPRFGRAEPRANPRGPAPGEGPRNRTRRGPRGAARGSPCP